MSLLEEGHHPCLTGGLGETRTETDAEGEMADATSFNGIWTFARDCVRRAAVGGRWRSAGSDTSGCHGYDNHSAPRDVRRIIVGGRRRSAVSDTSSGCRGEHAWRTARCW